MPHEFGRALVLDMGDDGQVEVVGMDAVDQHRCRLAHDRHLDTRIGLRETRHDVGQIAVGIVVRHAEPHTAGEFCVGEGADSVHVELDDAPCVVEQLLAVLGELGGATVALEDRLADALLQPLHLHRYRRLRLEHDIGGAREAAGLGDGDEGPELIDIQENGHASLPVRHGPGCWRRTFIAIGDTTSGSITIAYAQH
jgi:hypothetical protein